MIRHSRRGRLECQLRERRVQSAEKRRERAALRQRAPLSLESKILTGER